FRRRSGQKIVRWVAVGGIGGGYGIGSSGSAGHGRKGVRNMFFDLLAAPSQHNILWAWINALLPDATSSPWGFAMAVFSSTLTYVGALFCGWHIIAKIVSWAQSGKVDAQVWMPLRIVLGFGLLIPIAGNFSSSHWLLR